MTKGELEQLFNKFNSLTALIIGDVMIDAYYWGKVERISPEAPVPVVQVQKRENRLGGAANVALNVKSLGAKAALVLKQSSVLLWAMVTKAIFSEQHSKKIIFLLKESLTPMSA